MQVELSPVNQKAIKEYINTMKDAFPTFNSSPTALANMFIAEGVAKGLADSDVIIKHKKSGRIQKSIA